MDQIQSTQNVSFQAQQAKKESIQSPAVATRPVEIENGDKKSMDALKWVGAIGAATLAVGGTIYAIRNPEKLKKITDKAKKAVTNAKTDTKAVQKMSTKQAQEASLKTVKGVSQKAQDEVTDLKKALDVLKNQQSAYTAQKVKVDTAKAKVDDIQKQIAAARAKGVKTTKLEGHLSQAKGEYNKLNSALKKMKNPSADDIKKAGEAISEAAKKSPDNAAVIQMQRMKRKHPEISNETAKKIFDTNVAASKTTPVKPANLTYNQYLEKIDQSGSTEFMSREAFMSAKQKKAMLPQYREYLANLKKDDVPIPFSEFIKKS